MKQVQVKIPSYQLVITCYHWLHASHKIGWPVVGLSCLQLKRNGDRRISETSRQQNWMQDCFFWAAGGEVIQGDSFSTLNIHYNTSSV